MQGHDTRTALRQWAQATSSRFRRLGGEEAAAQRFLASRYNILVALDGGAALLFNSATRAMCRLDEKEAARYRTWEDHGLVTESEDPILAQMLLGSGYLVLREKDELQAVKEDYFAARHDRRLLMLTVAPTMACNLACGYCFQGLNKDLGKLDPRVPDAIHEFVAHQKESLGALNICWYGGEPLMARKEIFTLADRLISLCDANRIEYSSSIVTNGYFPFRRNRAPALVPPLHNRAGDDRRCGVYPRPHAPAHLRARLLSHDRRQPCQGA